jgi:uncharacterized protein|tara:strand:- start:527 stop:922 length:396 start_codon:yes stop_codon:yes gene_type:complete
MGERFINIEFPFQDDRKGKYLALNDVSEKAVKSDLMHLLLTNKDERLYLPNFGANLRKYLFEQNDEEVRTGIKQEIQTAVTNFIPNLQIDELILTGGEEGQLRNEHHTLVKIDYTVTQGTFRRSDSVQIEL